jgi:N4-(beta-N-acetylglucosaminyl)-L-asparaginase
MEFDSAIMDGATLQTGAVGALRNILPAIRVAQAVLKRTPHCLLTGEGASKLAQELGFFERDLLSDEAKVRYQNFLEAKGVTQQQLINSSNLSGILYSDPSKGSTKDTTVYIASDFEGNFAAGTSTSGWSFKYPGRIGDSAIVGAGFYVDNEIGGALCTHTGEMAMRISAARSICLNLQAGMNVKNAVVQTAREFLKLKGGVLGTVVMYAVDQSENHLIHNMKS